MIGALAVTILAAALWAIQSEMPKSISTTKPQAKASTSLVQPAPCVERTYESNHFTLCRADPETSHVRLILTGVSGKPLRSLAGLAPAAEAVKRTPLFGMNAGMYDDQGEPIGLYISGEKFRKPLNQRTGEGNFHLLPNGVFWVDKEGGFHVGTSNAFATRSGESIPVEATQSGPMLVIDGKLHPKFSLDGESRYIRNGVGVDAKGVAWFVISNEPVSFGKLARLFRDELDCSNALYFDGAVSSLWIPATGRMDIGPPLGPMILVEKR